MRNLSLSSSEITLFPRPNICATAIDLDQNVLYAASVNQNTEADVEVEIWKDVLDKNDAGGQEAAPSLLTMFSTTAASSFIPCLQIASFRVLPETNRLTLIMRSGDIAVLSLDDEDSVVDVEGTVEPGILGASWCPDDSLLALVTGEEKLILMTSTFDVLSETSLHTSEFGEDAPINVGWGSKQTQFHGSAGKAAAQAPSLSAQSYNVRSSPDDDTLPRISWRGDGAFFVVSSLSPLSSNAVTDVNNEQRRRVLRVYDRQASLQSTSEPVAGLEHQLAWRPSGNLIAGTQRFGFEGGGAGRKGRHDVVFFERNGLRHGEFGLREVRDLIQERGGTPLEEKERKWGYKVREMCWSSDSNVLGVWIERDEGDVVQLWTTGNYHWYLKQEILAPALSSSKGPGRFTSVSWHPEIALRIILTTSCGVIQRTYAWEIFASRAEAPNDSGSVAVLDGSSILLTSFRTQNIPPPMSSYQLSVPSQDAQASSNKCTPVHASFSPTEDVLAVLWMSGYVELWDLHTRIEPGRGTVMTPTLTWNGNLGTILSCRQIAMTGGGISDSDGALARVTILGSDRGGCDTVAVVELGKDFSTRIHETKMSHRNGRLVASDETTVWQAPDGRIFAVAFLDKQPLPVTSFPEFCFISSHVAKPSISEDESSKMVVFVGLSNSGKLYVASDSATIYLLATNANSLCIASGFVIFTTTAHEAHFAPLIKLSSILTKSGEADDKVTTPEWERRRVERGSKIITVVPSTMNLVLQMPRGNLETISPRPLVMEVVKRDLDVGNYRKAFFACRKHRIDLNVIVNHNQATFEDKLASFVEQVDDVDHINLFLASLGRGTQPPQAIANLCDALRLELERKDITRYVKSILTAYVVKTPPDHEAGLGLLLRLRESEPQLVEDAVKYIIFLVDANSLFDIALGMYDFSLVLMIAQHAQKDPREYLPFLRELRTLSKFYQRFRIDDYLKRHGKALRNLNLAGANHFDEAMLYVEEHKLYEEALSIWQHTDNFKSVLNVYGDWLFERREFERAALVFLEAEKMSKAMVAYEKALQWQELFDLALNEHVPSVDVISMGYRVADDLSSKKRYPEAARVLLDYSKDVRQAVVALVQGHNFSEARRVTTLLALPELVVEIIYPAALESRFQFGEDINDMREQLRKQVHRIQELRIKKVEEPDAFYGTEDITLHNVDVMTDVSIPATAFTRYTVAPTSVSRTSKRSSRSKRKLDRKIGSGRKGTVDEEEYLLKSIAKLVTRYNATQGEVGGLLPHLLNFTPEHREEAIVLQADLCQFEAELKTRVEEIWCKPAEKNDDVGTNGWTARMQEDEKKTKLNPVEKVEKPGLNGADWQIKLLHLDCR